MAVSLGIPVLGPCDLRIYRSFAAGPPGLGVPQPNPLTLRLMRKVRRSTSLDVNGANLRYEVRGSGPSLLLIHGTAGEAGHFEEAADALADEFTVVTYDRRGAHRNLQSVQRHADDAAGLARTLGLVPVAVYGHNAGASIALELVIRHPSLLRGAVVHEPPLVTVLENPRGAMAHLDAALQEAGSGVRAMYAAFVRAQEPSLWDGVDPRIRERLLATAERFTPAEAEVFAGYRPDESLLTEKRVPLLVLQGSRSTPHHHEANRWVAARTGAELVEIPGGHWLFLERTEPFVRAMRPFLRAVSGRHAWRNHGPTEGRE